MNDELVIFVKKVAAFFMILSISIVLVFNWIMNDIKNAVSDFNSSFQGKKFWSKIEYEIHRVANGDDGVTAEQIQKIQSDLKSIKIKWKPVIDEIW